MAKRGLERDMTTPSGEWGCAFCTKTSDLIICEQIKDVDGQEGMAIKPLWGMVQCNFIASSKQMTLAKAKTEAFKALKARHSDKAASGAPAAKLCISYVTSILAVHLMHIKDEDKDDISSASARISTCRAVCSCW